MTLFHAVYHMKFYHFSALATDTLRSPRSRRQRTTSQSQTSRSGEPILRGRRRTIYTAGRPPWYDCQGQLVEPFVIGKRMRMRKICFYGVHTVYFVQVAGLIVVDF